MNDAKNTEHFSVFQLFYHIVNYELTYTNLELIKNIKEYNSCSIMLAKHLESLVILETLMS